MEQNWPAKASKKIRGAKLGMESSCHWVIRTFDAASIASTIEENHTYVEDYCRRENAVIPRRNFAKKENRGKELPTFEKD